MKRATILLVVLGAVLIVVVWFFAAWQPSTDELAAVEAQIETTQANQAAARTRMGELQSVRERAPQLQAELIGTDTVIPRDPALPSALRQFQQAADDSGATLVTVAPGRPVVVEGSADGLHSLSVLLELRGSYFQILDTLRRLEDPAISPRGVTWNDLSLSIHEHPTLTASVSGHMFAVLPEAATSDGEPPADDGAAPADGAAEAEVHDDRSAEVATEGEAQ